MRSVSRTIAALLLVGMAGPVWSFPWDKDMVDQPSAKPQEAPAPAEPDAVPVEGGESVPAPSTDQAMSDAKDASAAIPNPVPASAESVARGKVFYEINCLVCHGTQGKGDGIVGQKFVSKSPADLTDAYTQDQLDGQLFFTITRGRATMPFYRDALSPNERWDVVNYVKQEFGKK